MSLPVFRGGGFLSFRVDFVGFGDHFRFFGMSLQVFRGDGFFSFQIDFVGFGDHFRFVWIASGFSGCHFRFFGVVDF